MHQNKLQPTRIFKAAKKYAGFSSYGRRVAVRDTDVFITSYPKSGNTWVRFIIANMLYTDGSTDFKNVNQRIPDIYTLPNRQLLSMPSPRYLKSHEYFDPRYPKILYVVRDVRSVIVSYYHHLTLTGGIPAGQSLSEFADRLLEGHINPYGSWQDNVSSWMKVRGQSRDKFQLVRYEDLKNNSFETCKSISNFLSLELDDNEIKKVIELSAFERMSSLEKAGIDQTMIKGATKPVKSGFVRSGKTEEWKRVLPEVVLENINTKCGTILQELGYSQE